MPFKNYDDSKSLQYYDSLAQLRQAVVEVLDVLGAINVNSTVGSA